MFVYKFGYHSPEDSKYFELFHEVEYSEDEFINIILNAVNKIVVDIIDNDYNITHKEYYALLNNNNKKIDPLYYDITIPGDHGIRLDMIVDKVYKLLISDFNFVAVEYTARFSLLGWAEILNENSWESYSSDKDIDFRGNLINTLDESKKIKYELAKYYADSIGNFIMIQLHDDDDEEYKIRRMESMNEVKQKIKELEDKLDV